MGLSLSPGGLCQAQHMGRSHPDAWESVRMHTQITSRCAGNLEASFPWRKSHGRKREHPTKTPEVPRLGPGSSRQPRPGTRCLRWGGGRVLPSLQPPASLLPIAPTCSLPPARGWSLLQTPGPPPTGCRGAVVLAWV